MNMSACTIVGGAVLNDQLHTLSELFSGRIKAFPNVFPQCLQIHRPCDDFIIILHNLTIHWGVERICLKHIHTCKHTHSRRLDSGRKWCVQSDTAVRAGVCPTLDKSLMSLMMLSSTEDKVTMGSVLLRWIDL